MQKGFSRVFTFFIVILLLGSFVYVQKKKETSLLDSTNKYLKSLPSSETIQISPPPSVDFYQPKGNLDSGEYWESLFRIIQSQSEDFVVFKFPKFPLEIKYPANLEGFYHDEDLTPGGYINLASQLRLKKDNKPIVRIYPGSWGTEGPTYTTKEPLYINGAQLVISGEKIDKIRGYEEKNPIKKTNSYTFTAKYPENGNRIWFGCWAENAEDETVCDQVASTIKFISK